MGRGGLMTRLWYNGDDIGDDEAAIVLASDPDAVVFDVDAPINEAAERLYDGWPELQPAVWFDVKAEKVKAAKKPKPSKPKTDADADGRGRGRLRAEG